MERLFACLEKRPLREEAYELLKKAIIYGKIEPQTTFYEDQLAEELGTSRTPIREATFKLEQEGLITKLPRGGFCVPEFSDKDVRDIFDLRRLLEGYAAGLLIDRVTADRIQALEENVKRSERALAENRLEDLIGLNTEFHDLLVGACDSKFLVDLIGRLRDHVTRCCAPILKIEARSLVSIEDHKKMIVCLKRRDRRQLKKILREHIETGKKVLLRGGRTGKMAEDRPSGRHGGRDEHRKRSGL